MLLWSSLRRGLQPWRGLASAKRDTGHLPLMPRSLMSPSTTSFACCLHELTGLSLSLLSPLLTTKLVSLTLPHALHGGALPEALHILFSCSRYCSCN